MSETNLYLWETSASARKSQEKKNVKGRGESEKLWGTSQIDWVNEKIFFFVNIHNIVSNFHRTHCCYQTIFLSTKVILWRWDIFLLLWGVQDTHKWSGKHPGWMKRQKKMSIWRSWRYFLLHRHYGVKLKRGEKEHTKSFRRKSQS